MKIKRNCALDVCVCVCVCVCVEKNAHHHNPSLRPGHANWSQQSQ